MSYEQFIQTLSETELPPDLGQYLEVLWHDAKKDWEAAHNIAQDIPDADGSWLHAYLHRVEGDDWNANYWYRRAGKTMPKVGFQEEWESMVRHFLTANL